MIVLELNEDDATRLCSGLNRFLVELEREIARTDTREYRQDLEKTEQVIREVSDELRRVA